jgi:HlyD family secretion protein
MLTEIISGISEGTEVLTDFSINDGDEEAEEQKASNPFMPKPKNNKNNQKK